MYAVIYQFQVKKGQEEPFQRNWRELTQWLVQSTRSLGARLHAGEHGAFVAYTQWPSKESYEQQPALPPEIARLRAAMLESCEDISGIQAMEVVEDLFAK